MELPPSDNFVPPSRLGSSEVVIFPSDSEPPSDYMRTDGCISGIVSGSAVRDEDPDSRDSGISMGSSTPFPTEFTFSQPLMLKQNDNATVSKEVFGLDEEMDDLVLEEMVADFNEEERRTEIQFRKLKKAKLCTSKRRAFGDVTNRVGWEESPKSHFKRESRPAHNVDATRRLSRQLSCFESRGTVCRKRFLTDDACCSLKRRNIPESPHNQSAGVSSVPSSCEGENLSAVDDHSPNEADSGDSPQTSNDDLPKVLHVDYSLKTVPKPQIESVAFKSISGGVLSQLMCSMSEADFERRYVLVDCRYPYEYNGGHLRGAINMFESSLVEEHFYPLSPTSFERIRYKIPIFYCEYSQKRGPTMAAALRQFDRKRNEARYPDVDYKEIYLLDRGYKQFFEVDRFMHLCEPPSYVRMFASPHKEDLKRFQLHKTKSCGNFTSLGARKTSVAETGETKPQRRGRLVFSCSESGNANGSPSRRPPRRLLFGFALGGSPFPPSESPPVTPPQDKCAPIPLPKFS